MPSCFPYSFLLGSEYALHGIHIAGGVYLTLTKKTVARRKQEVQDEECVFALHSHLETNAKLSRIRRVLTRFYIYGLRRSILNTNAWSPTRSFGVLKVSSNGVCRNRSGSSLPSMVTEVISPG